MNRGELTSHQRQLLFCNSLEMLFDQGTKVICHCRKRQDLVSKLDCLRILVDHKLQRDPFPTIQNSGADLPGLWLSGSTCQAEGFTLEPARVFLSETLGFHKGAPRWNRDPCDA